MTPPIQVFSITLIAGLFLFGAEIFVPGGVLGAIGAIALVGAIISGFFAFPGYGSYVAIGIIFLTGIAIVLWIRFFPKTSLGQRMMVKKSLKSAKGTEAGLAELLGKQGQTISALRPGGFALIDGQREDVVTQGEMIDKGTTVEVVEVEGNRVVVSATNQQETKQEKE